VRFFPSLVCRLSQWFLAFPSSMPSDSSM